MRSQSQFTSEYIFLYSPIGEFVHLCEYFIAEGMFTFWNNLSWFNSSALGTVQKKNNTKKQYLDFFISFWERIFTVPSLFFTIFYRQKIVICPTLHDFIYVFTEPWLCGPVCKTVLKIWYNFVRLDKCSIAIKHDII